MKGKVKQEDTEDSNTPESRPVRPEAPDSLIDITRIIFAVRAAVQDLEFSTINKLNVELVSRLRDTFREKGMKVYYPPEFNQQIEPLELSSFAQRWLSQFHHCSIIDFYAIFGYPVFHLQREDTGSIVDDPHGEF